MQLIYLKQFLREIIPLRQFFIYQHITAWIDHMLFL